MLVRPFLFLGRLLDHQCDHRVPNSRLFQLNQILRSGPECRRAGPDLRRDHVFRQSRLAHLNDVTVGQRAARGNRRNLSVSRRFRANDRRRRARIPAQRRLVQTRLAVQVRRALQTSLELDVLALHPDQHG